MVLELTTSQAWQNVNELNAPSRWKSVAARAAAPAVLAVGRDRPTISREDAIFCIGSCFAKNIEKKLVGAGFRVLSYPNPNSPADASRLPLPNIFNVMSIVNEFRWGLTDVPPAARSKYHRRRSEFPLRSPFDRRSVPQPRGSGATTPRRGDGNHEALSECRIVVITLGLVEVWYDRQVGVYLNATLPRFLLERQPERYALRVLGYQECLAGLEQALELLERHGRRNVEVFLSVSPVPLAATFTADDVLIANTYSKSIQMAAADALRRTPCERALSAQL